VAGGGRARWPAVLDGGAAAGVVKTTPFFFLNFRFLLCFSTLFSDSNSEFSKQIHIGLDLQEKFLYLCFFFSFGFGFTSLPFDLPCSIWWRGSDVEGTYLWCSTGFVLEWGSDVLSSIWI